MRFAANSLWRESKVSNERTTHSIGIAEPAVAGDLIKRTRARLDRGPRAFQSKAGLSEISIDQVMPTERDAGRHSQPFAARQHSGRRLRAEQENARSEHVP
jgi:hypothetical protein